MFSQRLIQASSRAFYKPIMAIRASEADEYAVSGLFAMEDVVQFQNRKELSVEMWADELSDINVRLVSNTCYVDAVEKESMCAIVVPFDTARNRFMMPLWLIELANRAFTMKGHRTEDGRYEVQFAVGAYDKDGRDSNYEPGVVSEIKLLRRVY